MGFEDVELHADSLPESYSLGGFIGTSDYFPTLLPDGRMLPAKKRIALIGGETDGH